MNCPGCDAEMPEIEGDEEQLRVCPGCNGFRVGVSELNRLLLHNNLPGIESLGGRVLKGAANAVCRTCLVDLTCFEGGNRNDPQLYEMCEECGCIFVAGTETPSANAEAAHRELVSFFRAFAAKKARPGA
ncbi:MAG: zf-TFIIB domain-containing protein [Myxococcaceae bacterium]